METWMNLQTPTKLHNDPVDPGSDDGEEALDCDDEEGNDTFSSYVALHDVTVYEAADLDAIAPLADTWDNDLDSEVSAQLVQVSAQPYLQQQGQISCSPVSPDTGGSPTAIERTETDN